MLRALTLIATLAAPAALALPAMAQDVAFGGMQADTSAPVEIGADALSVDQGTGAATFTGNVVIGQGQMRLAADKVAVTYVQGDQRKIKSLHATGKVALVSGQDAAEAQDAVYDVESGNVKLSGDVIITQGTNVMSGETMNLNLKSGTAQVSGRVRTVLQPGSN